LQPFLTFYFILTGHGSLPSISDMMEDIEIKRDHNNLYMKSQRLRWLLPILPNTDRFQRVEDYVRRLFFVKNKDEVLTCIVCLWDFIYRLLWSRLISISSIISDIEGSEPWANPSSCYWITCRKPRKWVVMYMHARGIIFLVSAIWD
jgi:hypothetical protein